MPRSRTRDLVVFNRGTAPFSFTAQASQPWLRVTPASGDVDIETPVRIDVDWDAVPDGEHVAEIDLLGSDRTEVRVVVPVSKPASRAPRAGFVESEGHIAIEAAHHARAVVPDGLAWETIPNLGRTLSAVTSVPVTAAATAADTSGAWLEYPVHLQSAGEVEVRVVLSPTLDYQHRGGLRYAVSFGDAPPQTVTMHLDPTPGHAQFQAWERAVSDSVHVATSRHRVEAGAQTLKLWRVDPGVVVQRIEIVRDGVRQSYLGPPESVRR